MAGLRPPLLLLLSSLALSCAREDPRGEAPLRTDHPKDATVVDRGTDGSPPDLGSPDAPLEIAEIAAPKATFVVVHGEPFSAGIRATLRPPHAPQPGAELADRFDASLVRWAGTGDPQSDWLLARISGDVATALYDLDARMADRGLLSDIDADIAWLAAHVLSRQRVLKHDGRALVGVRGAGRWPEAFARARSALGRRHPTAGWLVQLAVDDEIPLGADVLAAMPEAGYGASLARDRPRATPNDAAQRRAWADAAGLRDLVWLPVAAPPANPRLDLPDSVVAPPTDEAFVRSLVLARRAAGHAVVVDGLGAWRDDRQLNPVLGTATDAPIEVTTGVEYAGYGTARLDAVERLLRRPAGAPVDLSAPELVVLVDSPAVAFERLKVIDDEVWISATRPAAVPVEIGLSFVPFVVPDHAQLSYLLTDVEGYVDLVFADGDRLGAAGLGPLDLSDHTGRRVEEVVLVLPPGLARLEGRLAALAIR